jgi:hypothetical protein
MRILWIFAVALVVEVFVMVIHPLRAVTRLNPVFIATFAVILVEILRI